MDHRDRIEAYFVACGEGSEAEISAHFAEDGVVFDTNIRPMRTAADIGSSWVKVRERWDGARWHVDTCVSDGEVAAIEWSMTGTNPADRRPFVFRGSEHYRFAGDDNLISEIRQYWVFDSETLDTGLIEFDYSSFDHRM